MVIDGKKFLVLLGLPNDGTLTSRMVRDALYNLSEEERAEVIKEVVIEVPEEPVTLQGFTGSLYEEIVPYNGYKELDVNIHRKLKYEKNYMAKLNLRRQLGPDGFERGKHARGCKRKKKR